MRVSVDNFRMLPAEEAYEPLIQEAAGTFSLDPALIRAVIRTESRFDPLAISHRGARGLMQLMPELAAELRVTDPLDPRQNVFGGARYLRQLLNRHRGNVELAVASYNAGPSAVARYNNAIPPYEETREYVRKINRLLGRLEDVAADD